MKRKILWIAVISLPIILFFLLSFKTIKEIHTYFLLNQKITATLEDCKIINYKSQKYKIYVSYTYNVNNKIFKNNSSYSKNFINYINANDFKEKISKNVFYIWYNKMNPNISSVEKTFPIKNCFYLIISFLVFIYFLILKYYLYAFQKND